MFHHHATATPRFRSTLLTDLLKLDKPCFPAAQHQQQPPLGADTSFESPVSPLFKKPEPPRPASPVFSPALSLQELAREHPLSRACSDTATAPSSPGTLSLGQSHAEVESSYVVGGGTGTGTGTSTGAAAAMRHTSGDTNSSSNTSVASAKRSEGMATMMDDSDDAPLLRAVVSPMHTPSHTASVADTSSTSPSLCASNPTAPAKGRRKRKPRSSELSDLAASSGLHTPVSAAAATTPTDTTDSATGDSRPKRRRTQPKKDFEFGSLREEKHLALALRNSVTEEKKKQTHVKPARVFYPTDLEFAQPLVYIESIRPLAEKDGICVIQPPPSWRACRTMFRTDKKIPTRLQPIHHLQQAEGFPSGRRFTLAEYKAMADQFKQERMGDKHEYTADEIERDYWKIVETPSDEVKVEYANDLDSKVYGSGFVARDEVGNYNAPGVHQWNLNVLPFLDQSVLRHLPATISGVTVPWVYVGMLFASFCWHTEDDYLCSANYMHEGAVKTWYGIPASDAPDFERVMRAAVPELFENEPDLLFKLVTQLSPYFVAANKVHVVHARQHPGQFVITFPRAYHAGFSHGFNIGEAVNFAPIDWFRFSKAALDKYRYYGRASVFSHDHLLIMCAYSPQERGSPVVRARLAQIIAEETERRNRVEAFGIVHVEQAPLQHSVAAPEHKCGVCNYWCFLSYVKCPDHGVTACLDHAQKCCSCPLPQKTLVERWSLAVLNNLLHSLDKLAS